MGHEDKVYQPCRKTPSTNFADWVEKIWPSRIVSKAFFDGGEPYLYPIKTDEKPSFLRQGAFSTL